MFTLCVISVNNFGSEAVSPACFAPIFCLLEAKILHLKNKICCGWYQRQLYSPKQPTSEASSLPQQRRAQRGVGVVRQVLISNLAELVHSAYSHHQQDPNRQHPLLRVALSSSWSLARSLLPVSIFTYKSPDLVCIIIKHGGLTLQSCCWLACPFHLTHQSSLLCR